MTEGNKKTALYEEHKKLNAKMVPFGGWEMPVSYSGILDEHKTVRESVGIFDVSHMGEFFVSGTDAVNYLQSLVPQDISKVELQKAQYCQLPNEQGGIIDDFIIYNLGEKFLLIVNAAKVEEDFEWLKKHIKDYKIDLVNKSDEYSLIAVQGPKAKEVIKKLETDANIDEQKFLTITETKLGGCDILLARTGYTGEDGFEIMTKNENASKLWQKLLTQGAEFGIKPIGLGARDTLRLEAGLLLNGSDMDENTTPYEAGLGWSVSKNKTEDYIGKDKILRKQKKLIALEMTDNAIARHGYDIYYDGEKAGVITSGSMSPTLGKNIAIGYVTNLSIEVGTTIQIMIRNKLYNALVVKKPFIEKKYKM